jgi:hypothetical protein
MTAPKIIKEAPESNRRDPHKKFADLASKVVTVPKSEIEAREKQWQQSRRPLPKGRWD